MRTILLMFFVLLLTFGSCKDSSHDKSKNEKQEDPKPLAEFENLISDYKKWWAYHYYDISLSSDFDALNDKSERIEKGTFLEKLTSGNYIPIEVTSDRKSKTYKLFELPKNLDNGISSTIKNTASHTYKLFKMEGTKFPEFNVVDLNGIEYNNEKLKGKITVVKTWFIACQACIAEMPELNEFVDTYKNEDRIQFLSLSYDAKPLLSSFLKKTNFDYAVIGEQRELIQDKLNLQAYPTHIIIDENGIIKNVFEKASELIACIEKDTSLKKRVI